MTDNSIYFVSIVSELTINIVVIFLLINRCLINGCTNPARAVRS